MAKKDDNLLAEGKPIGAMTAQELEEQITKTQEVVEKPKEETRETKEQPKEETPKADTKQEEPLIMGKFKSWDDVGKAYVEAEKKISQQGEESSRAKRQAEQYRQQLSQVYDFDNEGNIVGVRQQTVATDPLSQLRNAIPGLTNVDDATLDGILRMQGMMINASLRKFKEEYDSELQPIHEIRFEREVEKQKKEIRTQYPDFSDFETEVNDALQNLPSSLRAKPGSVETLFLTVRGKHLPEIVEKTKLGALKEAHNIEVTKQDTLVEGSGRTSVPTPPVNTAKMSAKELEAYINSQIRK